MICLTSALLLFTELAVAQFVTAPTNLTTKAGNAGVNVRYKEVPNGICELDPNVKSYSGYADVAEDQHIFWWFFESRNVDPKTAPLTLWINGGPGASSLIGLFQELGPCYIDIDGNPYTNPYSWSNVSNMLFIDQPTTTGLSYSIPIPAYQDPVSMDFIALPNDTCPEYIDPSTCGTYNTWNLTLTANSTVAAAPNFYLTLQGFAGAFPQYASNGIYFATESYGGHYGPIFSRYIVEQNKLNTSAQLDFKGLLVGNGWYDPIIQYEAYYNFTSNYSKQTSHPGGNTYGVHWNATEDAKVYNALYGANNCRDQLLDCNRYAYATNTSDGQGNEVCNSADNFCLNQVEYGYDNSFGRDEDDSRYLAPDPFPPNFFIDYLNTPKVQAAIGAFVNYSEFGQVTENAFEATGDDARIMGVTEAVEYLLDNGVTMTAYFGDADYTCNWFGGETWSYTLSNVPDYTGGKAGFVNISTSDNIVHGVVKTAGNFSFVRIYESGHEVPFYQPLAALEMFNRTLHYMDIATGMIKLNSSYYTTGTPTSDYVEGNGTVTYEVIPVNATYNTSTNQPNPPYDFAYDDEANNGTRRLMTRYEHVQADFDRVARGEVAMPVRRSMVKSKIRGRRHRSFVY